MPIKGLTERTKLSRLGKIHLGIKVGEGKSEHPKPVDYFVCPEEVRAVYGEKPKQLAIMFPTENDGEWASQWYKSYSRYRGLICKGDGETAHALIDEQTGEIASKESKSTQLKEVACQPDLCPQAQENRCRPVMCLQFLLPNVPGIGIWQLDTSSYYSIRNVNSAIQHIRAICGRVSFIPLILTLDQLEVQPGGVKKNVYILRLTTKLSLAEIAERWRENVVPGQEPRVLLPTTDEVPDDIFPEAVDAPEAASFGDLFKVETVGDLLTAAYKTYGMDRSATLALLELHDSAQIEDPAGEWKRLRAMKEVPTE